MRGHRVLVQVAAALAVLVTTVMSPSVETAGASTPTGVPQRSVSAATAEADPVWSAPVAAIPDRGQPSDVSCPSTTWCMAVDLSGRVMTFDGARWTAPTVVFPRIDGQNPGVRAVSCPTTTFCLAVSDYGYASYRSGTWTVVRSSLAPFRAVSCYSATRCGLVRGDSNQGRGLTTWNGSTFAQTVTAPWASRVDAIACLSATVCHAVGVEPKGGAIALRASGSTWAASYLGMVGQDVTTDLSCTTASFCLVTSGSAYRTWRWNGSTWSGAAYAADGSLLTAEAVSCSSSTSCTAVGDGRVGRWNGSTWSVRTLFPIYGARYAVDCATASTCVVIDNRGRFWRGGGSTWTAAASFDATSQWVADLSCPTATFCMATDYVGNAIRWNGAAWTGISRLGTVPSSVSCVTATWCMTVDGQQGTSRLWNGSWSAPRTFDTINPYWPVECAATTACFSFQGGDMRRWDGRTWSAPARLFSWNGDVDIDCPTARFCMVVSPDGSFRRWNGTSWSASVRSGLSSTSSLSCTSSTFCMIASNDGAYYSTFNGSAWSVRRVLPYAVGPLGCQTTARCVTSDYDGVVWIWRGASWSASASRLGFQAIRLDCSATRCMAMGYEKASWTL